MTHGFESRDAVSRGALHRGIDPAYVQQCMQKLETSAREFKERDPTTEQWVRNTIEPIDLSYLQSVYRYVAHQTAGRVEHHIECVPFSRIYIVDGSPGLSATYDYLTGAIELSGSRIQSLLAIHDRKDVFDFLFHLILHENMHATGFVDVKEANADSVCIQAGYETILQKGSTLIVPHRIINEGVADLGSQLVGDIYLRHAPLRRADGSVLTAKGYKNFVDTLILSNSDFAIHAYYQASRHFAQSLSTRMAKECNITKETAIADLIGGFYRGKGFLSDFGRFIDEKIGAGFVVDIAAAKTESDLVQIAAKYDLPPLPIRMREQVQREVRSMRAGVQ